MASPQLCTCRLRLHQCTLHIIERELAVLASPDDNHESYGYSTKLQAELMLGCEVAMRNLSSPQLLHSLAAEWQESVSLLSLLDRHHHQDTNQSCFLRIGKMSGEQLSHEMLLNPLLRLEADEEMTDDDRRVALRIRSIREDAFWEVLSQTIIDATLCKLDHARKTVADVLGNIQRNIRKFAEKTNSDFLVLGDDEDTLLRFTDSMASNYEGVCIPTMQRLFGAVETIRNKLLASDQHGKRRRAQMQEQAAACMAKMHFSATQHTADKNSSSSSKKEAAAFCHALRLLLKQSRELRLDSINGRMHALADYMHTYGIGHGARMTEVTTT